MDLLPGWVTESPAGWFFLALALLDLLATGFWHPGVFMAGPVLLRRRFQLSESFTEFDIEELGEACRRPGQPMVFRRHGADVLLFRERWFHFDFSYMPVVRGVMEVDRSSRQLEVRGHLSWTLLGVALPILVIQPFLVVILLIFCSVNFWFQRVRFLRIGRFAAGVVECSD